MFWIYDIPNWLFFLICNTALALLSLLILIFVKKVITPWLKITDVSNDMLNYFIAAIGTLYSITLGLIAVGTWENYNKISQLANDEAASIAALYHDVSFYPDGTKDSLQAALKTYTRFVIDEAWPQQQKGMVPTKGNLLINNFQSTHYGFQPTSSKEQSIHNEALGQFNNLILIRRNRLASIGAGLPNTLWTVIFTGAFVLIFLFSLFVDENNRLHRLLIICLAFIIGTSIFLIAAMDYPYRGEFSVSPAAFELVYKNMH
jgi:hypothetical protein